jgi:hypothetical protein
MEANKEEDDENMIVINDDYSDKNENLIKEKEELISEEGKKLKDEVKGENIEIKPDHEKYRLTKVFGRLKDQLEEEKEANLEDVYLTYSEEQFMESKIKKKVSKASIFCYKLLLLIITMLYLTGSFLIISLKKSFWDLFISSFECYFGFFCDKEEFKKRTNFFEYFNKQLLREPIDLNLIMFWNFVGIKLSNLIGLRFSSFIFLLANTSILFSTYMIDYRLEEDENNYSLLKIIGLFFNWVGMAILFGGSSLLVQQKFIDYYSIFDVKDEDDNETNFTKLNENDDNSAEMKEMNQNQEEDESIPNKERIKKKKSEEIKIMNQKQKEDIKQRSFGSLIFFSLATLLAYLGKFGIAVLFTYYNEKIINMKNSTNFNNTNFNINYNMNSYFLYSNFSEANNTIDIYDLNQNIYLYICLIYIGCISISVILIYSLTILCFFKKKEKKKEEKKNNNENRNEESCCCECCCECCQCQCSCSCCLWKIVCEICGCLFYFERVSLEEDSKSNYCCCQLCCESINNFCEDAICNMLNCRKNKTKNVCCRCDKYTFNEEHFDKNRQCFCYCYQVKGCCYWMNKFFINQTQKEIIFCVILYFISRLASIGCEKQYDNIIKNNDIFEELPAFFTSIGYMLILFIIFFAAIKIIKHIKIDDDIELDLYKYLVDTVFKPVKKFNFIKIALFIILAFNISYGGLHSFESLFKVIKDDIFDADETFGDRTCLYMTILTNTFFVFLLNYYCLIITKNENNFEYLLSQTILVSIYMNIINLLIFLIKFSFENIKILFYIQLAITYIFDLIFVLIIYRWAFYLLLFSCQTIFQLCGCCEESYCYNNCCKIRCLKYICCESFCAKLYDCVYE